MRASVDEGSDTSFVSVAFVHKLGFLGRTDTLRIRGVFGEGRHEAEEQKFDVLTGTNKRQTVTV